MGHGCGSSCDSVCDAVVHAISQHLVRLEVLDLPAGGTNLTGYSLVRLGSGCPSLTCLKLYASAVGVVKVGPNNGNLMHNPDDVFELEAHGVPVPGQYMYDTGATAFRTLVAGCPRIGVLDLMYGLVASNGDHMDVALQLLCGLDHLHTLKLSRCPVDDRGLATVASGMRQLRQLGLSKCTDITVEGLKEFVSNCARGMRVLAIDGCPQLCPQIEPPAGVGGGGEGGGDGDGGDGGGSDGGGSDGGGSDGGAEGGGGDHNEDAEDAEGEGDAEGGSDGGGGGGDQSDNSDLSTDQSTDHSTNSPGASSASSASSMYWTHLNDQLGGLCPGLALVSDDGSDGWIDDEGERGFRRQ